MLYRLTFKFHGKEYSISEENGPVFNSNQYEAIVVGFMLGKLEAERLSSSNIYLDLCLTEFDGSKDKDAKLVWQANYYQPISIEVK